MRLRIEKFLKGRNILLLLLVCVFVKNLVWIFSFPIFQAPDENRHFEYVRYLVEYRRLPFFKDENGGWISEESTFVAQALEFQKVVRKRQVKQDFSLATEKERKIKAYSPKDKEGTFDWSTNIYAHPPAYYLFLAPFYWVSRNADFFFRFYFLRIMSSFLSLGTGAIIYLLGLRFLKKRSLAFGASLLLAFQPTFSFISAALSNDNLVYLVYSSVFYLALIEFDEEEGQPKFVRRYKNLLWGIVLGVGMLTKGNFLPAILIFVFTVLLLALRKRRAGLFGPLFKRYILVGSLVILIAGWWYLTNLYLYGEPARGVFESGLFSPTERWDLTTYRGRSIWYYLLSSFTARYRIVRWGVLGWLDTPISSKPLAIALGLLGLGFFNFLFRYLYSLVSWVRKKKVDVESLTRASILFLGAFIYDLFLVLLFLMSRITIGRPNFPNQVRYYLPTMPILILLVLWGVGLFRNKIVVSLILCAAVVFMICFNFSSLFNYLIPRYY